MWICSFLSKHFFKSICVLVWIYIVFFNLTGFLHIQFEVREEYNLNKLFKMRKCMKLYLITWLMY